MAQTGHPKTNSIDLVPKGTALPRNLITNLRCVAEVSEMIRGGLPLPDIAAFIQQDQLEALDVPRENLLQRLREFRAQLDANVQMGEPLQQPAAPEILPKDAPVRSTRLDEAAYLTKLAELQWTRIQEQRQREIDGDGKPNQFLMRELEMGVMIAEAHSKVRERHGLELDGAGSHTPSMPQTHADQRTLLGKVLKDPKRRTRVLSVVNGAVGRANVPLNDAEGNNVEHELGTVIAMSEAKSKGVSASKEEHQPETPAEGEPSPAPEPQTPEPPAVDLEQPEIPGLPKPYNPFEDEDE